MENGTAKAWYDFEPDGEATKVTMGFATDFGWNLIGRWMGVVMFPSEMEKAYDYNLEKLKTIAEAKPRFTVQITHEDVGPVSYIGIPHTMSHSDVKAISDQMGKMYTELFTATQKAKVNLAGSPFCIFPRFDEQTMDMVCALPVPADAKLPAKYKIEQMAGGKVVKAIHMGSYDKLKDTHEQLEKYLEFKKLEVIGAPWEVYVTDPMTEKDESKWKTEVYYPIKASGT